MSSDTPGRLLTRLSLWQTPREWPGSELASRTGVSLFFFQAEDGIRDKLVTGVQTCALPIYQMCEPFQRDRVAVLDVRGDGLGEGDEGGHRHPVKRRKRQFRPHPAKRCRSDRDRKASCRERV